MLLSRRLDEDGRMKLQHEKSAQQLGVERYQKTAKGKTTQRRTWLKTNYNLTLERYAEMLAEQRGVCALCFCPETRKTRGKEFWLTVDHDHKTGKVRKLLCHKCNAGIGFMGENPDRLRAAAAYLESFL